MSGGPDYGDYVRYLRDSTVALRELAARENAPGRELIEIADRLGGVADELSVGEAGG